MAELEFKLEQQLQLHGTISNSLSNLKKVGVANLTRQRINTRLTALSANWEKFMKNHDSIGILCTQLKAEARGHAKRSPYFSENVYENCEEIYIDNVEQMTILLDSLVSTQADATSSNQMQSKSSNSGTAFQHQLPRINLPKFSGNYLDWPNFRDLFSSIVGSNTSLPNVEKLHHLKTCLTDEAASLLHNIPNTSENFARAWEALRERYENRRMLVNAQLSAISSVKAIRSDSASDLKRLIHTIHDAVGALQALGRPPDQSEDWLVHHIAQRLDHQSLKEWETSIGASTELPTYEDLRTFIMSKIRVMESLGQSIARANPVIAPLHSQRPGAQSKIRAHNANKRTSPPRRYQTGTPDPASAECILCRQIHPLHRCEDFVAKPIPQRREYISTHNRCFNCLGAHAVKDCPSSRTCRTCGARHHSLLHKTSSIARPASPTTTASAIPCTSASPTPRASSTFGASDSTQINTHVAQKTTSTTTLLATALVTIEGRDGRREEARALIDPCSEANFVTESLTQRLRLKRRAASSQITGIGASPAGTSRGIVQITLASRQLGSHFRCSVSALVLPQLTGYAPSKKVHLESLSGLEGIRMADPHFYSNRPIDLIIGCEAYALIIRTGIKTGIGRTLVAQETTLGWILTGRVATDPRTEPSSPTPIVSCPCTLKDTLPELLQRFWDQEEVAPDATAMLSDDERHCEDHFLRTHTRLAEGRYMVRLPFKVPVKDHGDARAPALRTLHQMHRRFQRDDDLRIQYHAFLEEYLSSGHMREATRPPQPGQCAYLPHHGVFRERNATKKLRVVFNGSQRTSTGASLNDALHAGPKLQTELSDVLLRWRRYRYVFSADIAKMFRQIQVHPEDRDWQRILWQPDTASTPLEYQLTTVTYGLTSSPYQALRVLKQLATDEYAQHPRASALMSKSVYVDDVLAGDHDLAGALDLRRELTSLLTAGGFPLRKWVANDPQLLADLPEDWVASAPELSWQADVDFELLGLHWQPESDEFTFRPHSLTQHTISTKRAVLSHISRLFDPLGWLAPATIRNKVFMQTLWLLSVGWDDTLPPRALQHWQGLQDDLHNAHLVRIPRWLECSAQPRFTELHGFCDASNAAYAAAMYLRQCDSNGATTTRLICAKTKVAPLKQVSIPRLELCGAQLLAKLAKHICMVLELSNVPLHLWTDSATTLAWINAVPSTWKTFVANRVSSIQTTAPSALWHHVAGQDNPADCATRGVTMAQLSDHPLWWEGPPWLTTNQGPWPASPSPSLPASAESNERRVMAVPATVTTPAIWTTFQNCASQFTKLLRITAWCLRWRHWLRSSPLQLPRENSKVLMPVELDYARQFWIRTTQHAAYPIEVAQLRKNKGPVPRTSPLHALRPFIDERGLLRVGGRLKHSALDPDEIHPVILPKSSHFTDLLIDSVHRRMLHGGVQLTLATLRQTYWITRGRQAVKSRLSTCLTCLRHRATTAHQQMGNLPSSRVLPSRPFLHTGLDYCGPINIRLSPGRGHKTQKGYIVVFVCFSTRAVYLDAVSGYTAAHFLAAFRRFASRRGIPASLNSDQGTNFIGANAELRTLFTKASEEFIKIADALATDGTTWKFNPPGAPHQGGLWEAAVKSTKHHLKRVIGNHTLTYEEMSTTLAQIEACLNSRPLQASSDDPTDLSALTPGHFLIGCPLSTIPEPSLMETPESRLNRWQLLQKMKEDFWRRWSSEYLHSLQTLPKWRNIQPSVKVGDLAILKNELLPPSKWALCRVVATHPGSDGLVRVVTVRTATSTLQRPVTKLCLLPRADIGTPTFTGEA